jgi:hypothetical protein
MTWDDKFCPSCGGDRERELEIAAFTGPALASARKWILAVGILYGVSALILYAMMGDQLTSDGKAILLGTNFGLLAIHIGLWVWARTAPFPAAVVALVLFVTVHAVNAVLEPESIYKGIVIKIIFLVVLIKAVQAGHKANQMRRPASARIAS